MGFLLEIRFLWEEGEKVVRDVLRFVFICYVCIVIKLNGRTHEKVDRCVVRKMRMMIGDK